MPKSEQGVNPDRYQLIPRVLIFVLRGDEVLLLKGGPHKRIWANRYNGIGGHVERGEDVLSAARRELREESGLEVETLDLRVVGVVDTDQSIGIGMYIFSAEYNGGALRESNEGSLEWIPMKQIGEIPVVEDLPVLIPAVMRARDENRVLFSLSYYDEHEKLCLRFS